VPPEVVIADVELPELDGVALAIALKSVIPDCKILLLSEKEAAPDLPASASRGAHEFEVLKKPIKSSDLSAHVSACLEPRKN